jgi:MFS superfamily sulfate permease-like transporter
VIEIFQVIEKTNAAAFIIAVVAMIFLYSTKRFINERYKAKLPFPLPFELIMIIGGIVISYLVDFNGRWNVKIVGSLPQG